MSYICITPYIFHVFSMLMILSPPGLISLLPSVPMLTFPLKNYFVSDISRECHKAFSIKLSKIKPEPIFEQ